MTRTEQTSLDLSPEVLKVFLDQTTEMVIDFHKDLHEKKAYPGFSQKEVESWFNEELPKEGKSLPSLLKEVKSKVMDSATYQLGPHMYAYVSAGGNHVSIAAEKLAATINQNVAKWHLAPALTEIEKRVAQWAAEFVGYGKDVGGVMVSGGSEANLAGLTVARNIFFEKHHIRKKGLFGMKPFTVYASSEVHGCVDKSLELLGIGTDHLRRIPVLDDFSFDLKSLEETIEIDISNGFLPFCLIGNAGTVNTGHIDPLDKLAAIAQKYAMWFHIDGAYGGLAGSLDTIKTAYKGIELADSLAIDFHKWLYQPFEAGCMLVKNWNALNRTYYKRADYLDTNFQGVSQKLDFNEHYFQLSRNSKAFKVWMSFKAYGTERLKQMIQKDIDLTHYLAESLEVTEDFEVSSRSDLAVCCFRYIGGCKNEEEIEAINRALIPALEADGRVFIMGTVLHGKFAIRACLINHRKQLSTIDTLIQVIREVAEKMQEN